MFWIQEESQDAGRSQAIGSGAIVRGAAAERANPPKPLFLVKLADHSVDRHEMPENELRRDAESAQVCLQRVGFRHPHQGVVHIFW